MAAPSRALFAHLHRRAGFGATPAELDAAEARGWDAEVERLLAGLKGPAYAPSQAPPRLTPMTHPEHYDGNAELASLTQWWVELMEHTATPLREKLVLMLHSQFPTAISKVGWASMMLAQNEIFRNLGPGRFDELTRAVAKDPSMLIWLDAAFDVKTSPNENFARELMERFTMGIGHYSQQDVRESARCFAGWALSFKTGRFTYNDWAVDYGWKTVLGQSGNLNGDDVISIVTSDPSCAPFVTSRIWSWLAFPATPTDPVVTELAAGFAKDLDMSNLLAAMLHHPAFVSPASTAGLVKQPVEHVVGTMRAFGLVPRSFKDPDYPHQVMAALGQELFNPPNVGGWGSNSYWLSTATSMIRLGFATEVAKTADLEVLWKESVRGRTALLAEMLGVTAWSNETIRALHHVRHIPELLVTYALVSPEYVAN